MGSSKSLDLDGYTSEFFRGSWDTIKETLFQVFKDFHYSSFVPLSWKKTHLIFIPKKINYFRIEDYRLVALCNVIYKILTKIIANRVKPYFNNLINHSRFTFVLGHNIYNNTLIANELAHSMTNIKSNKPFTSLKLNLSKAFDSISLFAIVETFSHIGFLYILVKWIQSNGYAFR